MAETAKPTRAAEVRERRRKPGSATNNGIKLALDQSQLDPNYHHRFVRSDPARVRQLIAQDYDPVSNSAAKPDSTGMGSVPTALGGLDEAGKPYDLILMRKPKDWHEADQKEKMKPLDENDEAIRRGLTTQKHVELRGPGVYTPDEGNSI